MKTPYPPQQLHIDILHAVILLNGAAFDTSETGCGKTLCSIEVVKKLNGRPFIIAPKSTLEAWRRECEEHGIVPVDIVNYEKLKLGRHPRCSLSGGRFEFKLPVGTVLIFDEVHMCKAFYTKNAKLLIAAHKWRTLMLSATAAEHPGEMRASGFVARLHQLFNFTDWAKKLGCTSGWGGGGLDFDGESEHGKRGLAFLNRKLYPLKGHRLLKSDLKQFFKEERIIDDPIVFGDNNEIAKLMAEVADELSALAEVEQEDRKSGGGAEALVKLLRARQKVEILKIPETMEMVEQALSDHFSVPVFLNYNDTIRALSERLTKAGIEHGIIWGEEGIHLKRRQEYIDMFNDDRLRVLLCNMAAGGASINLHHTTLSKHPRQSLISPNFNAKQMHQVFGRIHRAGEQSDAIQRLLIAAGTVEEKVMSAVRKKIDNMRLLHQKDPLVITTPAPMETPAPTPAPPRVVFTTPNPPGSDNTSTTYAPAGTPIPPEGTQIIETPATPPAEAAPKKTRSPRQPRNTRNAAPVVEGQLVETPAAETPDAPVEPAPTIEVPAPTETPAIPAPSSPVVKAAVEEEIKTVFVDDPADPTDNDRPHAPYSPSSLEWRSLCPGYTGKQEKDDEVNEMALSGTRCHTACETRDLSELSEEEVVLADMCMGYEDEVLAGNIRIEREIRIECFDQWGYLDLIGFMSETEAHIIDYKFGRLAVRAAEKNLQMKAYTMGCMNKYPDLQKVTVHLAQPRLNTISYHTFTRDDLPTIAQELFLVIERAKGTQENFNDHTQIMPLLQPFCESCDYCGNRWRCPALALQVLTIVSKHREFVIPENVIITPGELRTPDEAAVMRRAAEIAAKWGSEVKDWTLEMAMVHGIVPTGYNLLEANSPRQVNNVTLAFEALSAETLPPEQRMTMAQIMEASKGLSIGKLEEQFTLNAPKGKKAAWKTLLGCILLDAGAVGSSGTYHKLVPKNEKK